MKLVQKSFAQVLPMADATADRFYARLFELDPAVRGMFPPDMTLQKQKFMSMLNTAVDSLDRLDDLVPTIQALGVRHGTYGVTVEQYDTVRQALMWAFQKSLGDAFTPEVKAAWVAVYTLLANTMQQAAGYESQLNEPASMAGDTAAAASSYPAQSAGDAPGERATATSWRTHRTAHTQWVQV